MTFRKGHKDGAPKQLERPLGKQVIAFRPFEGQREAVQPIPDLQGVYRDFTDQLAKLKAFPGWRERLKKSIEQLLVDLSNGE